MVWNNEETDEWGFFDNLEELYEELKRSNGREFTIICEPDWNLEEGIIRGYSPDSSGVVGRGKY